MSNAALKITRPSIIKILYQMTYDIHQIFANASLKYWAIGGTLLGCHRSHGIIFNDNDLDFGIHLKDRKKFIDLIPSFNKCGYSVIKHNIGYKIFITKRKNIKGFDYSFPNCDIFLYKQNKETERYELYPSSVREMWPKDYFLKEELAPLKLYNFGSFEIYGPNKTDRYLKKLYGADYMEVTYVEYEHEKEEQLEKVKVKLTKQMLKPAEPYDEVRDRNCVNKVCMPKYKKEKVKKVNPLYWMKKLSKKCVKSGKYLNNFIKPAPFVVINCKSHFKRMEKFEKYAKAANLEYKKIECVYGRKFTQEIMCSFIEHGVVSDKADMNPVEISICMSHFNAWLEILNTCDDVEYGFVCEDDVEVHANFIEKVNAILSKVEEKQLDFSLISLWAGHWMKVSHKKVAKVDEEITLMQATEPYNHGAVCYCISKKYIRYLVNRFFPIKDPNDIFMAKYVNYGKHLAVKMTYDKKDKCYISPILDNPCGGEGGTGAQSVQTYEEPPIYKRWSCNTCA